MPTAEPVRVDPAFERDWQRVRSASDQDPGGAAVVAAADQLLARDPPTNLRLAAVQAKVGHAYINGADDAAIRMADEMLASLDAAGGARRVLEPKEFGMVVQLQRLRALARARGGDPQLALSELKALLENGQIPEMDWIAASAMAHERAGQQADATLAYARWRERASDDSAAALYCERKIARLARGLDANALEGLARRVPGTNAGACLLTRAGHRAATDAPDWVNACATHFEAASIGVLLPRSGRFAALADEQLAAVQAGVRVLARRSGDSDWAVLWEDTGSDPAKTRTAARRLLERGASIIVGPISPDGITAAADTVAGAAELVIPGEGREKIRGVAPTLEARGQALAGLAQARGLVDVVLLRPPTVYGRRVADGIQSKLDLLPSKSLKILEYPPSTTSFKKILEPAMSALRSGSSVLIIADRVARMELVVRQLGRDGVTVDRPGAPGLIVMTTGEGVSARDLGRGHEILDGVYVAPAAWPSPEAADFAAEYLAMIGEPPGDQAWLVWRALVAAWTDVPTGGDAAQHAQPQAAVLRVERGRLVPTEITPATETPAASEAARVRPPE
ncbi:MAG: ABC transporter substrate-binding protein [Myxococcales bacterium]|nr:ABC transporter substrate-binding protein [Myxococcales bacterium]